MEYSIYEGLKPFYDKQNELYGYMDVQGNRVIDSIFDWAEPFENGYAQVVLPSKADAIIDTSGEVLFTAPSYLNIGLQISMPESDSSVYYYIHDDSNDDRKEGVFNIQNGIIIPAVWDDIQVAPSGNFYAVNGEEFCQFSKEGKLLGQW